MMGRFEDEERWPSGGLGDVVLGGATGRCSNDAALSAFLWVYWYGAVVAVWFGLMADWLVMRAAWRWILFVVRCLLFIGMVAK